MFYNKCCICKEKFKQNDFHTSDNFGIHFDCEKYDSDKLLDCLNLLDRIYNITCIKLEKIEKSIFIKKLFLKNVKFYLIRQKTFLEDEFINKYPKFKNLKYTSLTLNGIDEEKERI